MAIKQQGAATRVSTQTVEKAVKALLKWRESKNQTQKPKLIEEDEFVYLTLSLKKIPPKERINAFKIPLPHPLHSHSSEICLIIDDRPKSGLTKYDAVKKIKSEGIPISKVLKFSKLKSDYKPFESKRKVCGSFDLFLADKRVVPLLPRLLGKHFFKKKKKIPVPVDLRHRNWKEQVERVLGSALLFLSTGTCCVVRVAKVSMAAEEIVENAVAAIHGVAEVVPRKWGNVRAFHLKLMESLALPVYQAVPDLRLKIERAGEDKVAAEQVKEEGVKSVDDDEKVMKNKGRIHAVRYMDVNVEGDEEEVGGDGGWNAGEEGTGSENDAMNTDEKVGKKKRKKGDAVRDGVLGELNGKRQLKKSLEETEVKKKKDGLSAKVKKENTIKKEKKGALVGKLKTKKSRQALE